MDYKRKRTITISIDEYEFLKSMDDLTHKQRFTIESLKKNMEALVTSGAIFSRKTFALLKELGMSDQEIFNYYQKKEDE